MIKKKTKNNTLMIFEKERKKIKKSLKNDKIFT
jgi:hypothetical protein